MHRKPLVSYTKRLVLPLMGAVLFALSAQVHASDFLIKEHSVKQRHEKAEKGLKGGKTAGAKKKPGAHPVSVAPSTHASAVVVEAQEALERLREGNRRYVAGKMLHKGQNALRRAELANGQHPFAVILSCSDSRVPPEILFDQGLGDLFVIRTAGEVADDIAIASIEYAVAHLGTRLIVVLGHERCGAVTAAVEGGEAPGQLAKLVAAIRPAVEKAKEKHGDLLDESVKANIKIIAQQLKAAKPILAEAADDGILKVVGAYYDLDTGAVSITYKPCM